METSNMKKGQSQTPAHNTKFNANKQRPEVRDNLDSRSGEEQETKGDDTTHNQREHSNKHPEKKK